ncbi:MAG TPA: glycosyltransferase family 39 protein [Candidatus Limnocylindria bacterium]|jgi:dolichyl-phosphate-mannose--protein O-mannosyl transferase|nr:glycosyltransferase family 39 protein [Candidatus Limnocylindria bacterium]
MSTPARIGGKAIIGSRAQIGTPLLAILAVGLIARLLFLGSEGFHNDVAAFESWTLTLRDNPPWAFYAKSGFADYPPGYFVVLWFLGKVYAVLPGAASDPSHGYALLRTLVKLPAIAMDLVDAAIVYAIARRYAAQNVALLAAAFLAFNPAAIFVSSYWGQVDSVSWGLVLLALWSVLRAGDDPAKTVPRLTWAWLAFAFSLLIKPQAATLGLLLLVHPFATADAQTRARRLAGTAAGIGASLGLAFAVGAVFHGNGNPVAVFGWLLGRYTFASGVYPYNSVNAFNLYALHQAFWQPDGAPLSIFGLPLGSLGLWGILLVAASTVLIAGRYLQRRDDRALLEGALLVALAFFILATRMHERYVYGAFLLAIPLIAFGRTGLWSAILLTVTTYLNLAYSFAYQTVMEAKTPGVDATDLWPLISHPAALANVALFFWLGYRYLGGEAPAAAAAPAPSAFDRAWSTLSEHARTWFDPREGIVRLTRTDWLLMGGFGLVAFVLAVVNLGWPHEKIFDEIYFARAGEEYLKGIPQFEWTHPPITKLLIALSIALFGDTSFGWRFLNVVVGALEVGILYAFAKRLTASTLFASLGALLLTFDGFHFVEQRISTGEITISTLILIVLYAFYRYWLAAQIRLERLVEHGFGVRFWVTMAIGIPVAAAFSWVVNYQPPHHLVGAGAEMLANGIYNVAPSPKSYVIPFIYALLGVYLFARLVVARRLAAVGTRVSYAEGTVVQVGANGKAAVTPPPGEDGEDLTVTYGRDGAMRYATPAAVADFSPDGTLKVDGQDAQRAGSARVWLAVLVVAMGFLVASKWNGFFDLAIVFVMVALVCAQRFLRSRAHYGNPRGFPLDVVYGLLLFVPATIYAVSYLPMYLLGNGGHTLADMFELQYQMFYYHSHVTGTHPYMSVWWQWPIMQIPISYYYHDFRAAAAAADPTACCVAEILALPNPAVFLLGLVSVPFTAWLAWRERNKGYALLVIAYFLQWLPWFHSPRMLFEYHFFPNLALIVLCDVVLLQRIFRRLQTRERQWYLGGYVAVVIALFAFFYPVVAGVPVTYNQWYARMWPDELHIPYTSWILPHH